MNKQDKIFNTRKRRVFRTRIPRGEALFGAAFCVLVGAMGVWFWAQKDNFDPSERDISMDILIQDAMADTLYRTPLQRWVEPGQALAAGSGANLGIFPAAVLDGGWEPASRPQEFDESNLYEKINGAAPLYFSFGFRKLHYVSLKQPASGLEISIELYDMGAFENALGIFAAQRDLNQALEERAGAFYYPTSVGAIGVFKHFYFKLTATDSVPAVQEKSLQLIGALAGIQADSTATPWGFATLNKGLGIPFQSIVFEKQDVFQYDFAKDFWFGAAPDGANTRYYLHESASADEAQALYDQLAENHLYDYSLVEKGETSIVFKHNFLNTYMTLHREGTLIYGVDNAPSLESLELAEHALTQALENGEKTETYPAS